MISKPVVLALLAAGCVTAAAGGAFVAVRQNAASTALPATAAAVPSAPSAAAAAVVPVDATEAEVQPPEAQPSKAIVAEPPRPAPDLVEAPRTRAVPRPVDRPRQEPERRNRGVADRQSPAERSGTARPASATTPLPVEAAPELALPEPARIPEPPPAPPVPEFVELMVPAASVIGLQVETPLSSERAQVEDRVEARVTRDVIAGDRVAIPAGARVVGSVTLVERGGKIKDRARLGVRFHTIVFANGNEVPIRTDAVYREGESPGPESSAKIGGAAVGGAILGAILGGGKGAAIGGATGAAGGTAAVMAGGRNAATLPAGTVVTVRLIEPVSVDVEKR